MSMIRSISFVIFLFITGPLVGQNKTYLGFEASVTNDIYEISDNGNELKTVPLLLGLWGFNIRQEIGRVIFLEAAFIGKYYEEGYGFKSVNAYGTSNAINAWIIPIRMGATLNLYKDIIRLTPVVGYSFCVNSDYGYGLSFSFGGKINDGTKTISYGDASNYDLHQKYSLLQGGFGIEFKIFKQIILTVSTNYYAGFQEVIHLDIVYQKDNDPTISGTASSKGQFWSFGSAVRYPISNIWSSRKKS